MAPLLLAKVQLLSLTLHFTNNKNAHLILFIHFKLTLEVLSFSLKHWN
jgi:hypothetical protein